MGISRAGAIGALTLLSTMPGAAARPAGGTIVGVVSTKEASPKAMRVTVDPGVCGASLPDESITVDGSGRVANAVVTLAGIKAAAPAEVQVSNDTCRFLPHVSLIRPKGVVKATSKDPVLHTMHAAETGGRALFNVSMPVPGMTLSKSVDKPGVVTLTCSTHPWMRGYLVATDELSSLSAADGAFKLDGVPAGTHTLRIWHEALKAAPITVTVKDGATATVSVTLVK